MLSLGAIVRREQPTPALNPRDGRFGLPADFLIASDGAVVACKYDSHVYDQWSVDEILRLSRESAIFHGRFHSIQIPQGSSIR